MEASIAFSFDWALFFSALISSTLFPGGSEALLLYRRKRQREADCIKIISVYNA